jgi:hypothetical protein
MMKREVLQCHISKGMHYCYITNFKFMVMEHMEEIANCIVVQKFNTTELN